MTSDIGIFRYLEIVPEVPVVAGLNEIFFEASATKQFADEASRAAFRDLWLGSYLRLNPDQAFIALAPGGRPAGYVVGALGDPARDERYASLGYLQDFALLTRDYPAHLHINLAPRYRSQGLGAKLVDAFAQDAAAKGCRGLHIVTGDGMRNVGFYLRNGFAQVAATRWKEKVLVMMARAL